jgi:hypothetical protein
MTPGLCSNEHCATGGSFCESCFSSFLLHGCPPDLPCITEVIDDEQPETTLILRNGEYQRSMTITEENRDLLAYGGWQGWVRYVERLSSSPSADGDAPTGSADA